MAASLWFGLGFALMAVELLLGAVSGGWLLFVGAGGLTTGVLLWSGWLHADPARQGMAFAIATLVWAVLLWRPMKRMQNRAAKPLPRDSDLVGHRFRLEQPIGPQRPGKTRWSGIEWRVEPMDGEVLQAGDEVEVQEAGVGVWKVRKVS